MGRSASPKFMEIKLVVNDKKKLYASDDQSLLNEPPSFIPIETGKTFSKEALPYSSQSPKYKDKSHLIDEKKLETQGQGYKRINKTLISSSFRSVAFHHTYHKHK